MRRYSPPPVSMWQGGLSDQDYYGQFDVPPYSGPSPQPRETHMPDTSHLGPSDSDRKPAMSAADLDPTRVYKLKIAEATIAKVRPWDLRNEDDVPEDQLIEKVILDFDKEKVLFLNKTNLKALWSIAGSTDTDDFVGCEVELSVIRYNNGKDGIMLSAVREQDDDIPF